MWFFLGSAVQDWARGKINVIVLAIPILIMVSFFADSFMRMYVPVFSIMLVIWIAIGRIPKKYKALGITMGFGDVLAVPLAMSISYAAHPFFGPVAFAAVYAALLPPFLNKKSRRLLPWLIPPTAAAVLLGFIF